MRAFRFVLILVAFFLLGMDLYLSSRGVHLCPYESCRIVASTPFAYLMGYPLTFWGMFFFAVAALLVFWEEAFALWCALGMGFSLYMLYLQAFVIEKLCQLCLLVEFVVLMLFVTVLMRGSSLKKLYFLGWVVIVGFLSTHALYTFPPSYFDTLLEKSSVWRGDGEYRVKFFFDPLCPACARAKKLLEQNRDLLKEVDFKALAIHKGSFYRARVFYSMCLSGKDPWRAFDVVHSESFEYNGALVSRAKVKGLVDANLKCIEALGVDAVPVMVVEYGKRRRIFVGAKELEEWLSSLRLEEKPSSSSPLFLPFGDGVCTPKRCD